ncbi:abortive infection protein [Aureibacter tunicatorum]|nr:abortive infection protein [Aureibacter tunicatorum]
MISLGALLFGIGLLGVISLITLDIPFPEDIQEELSKSFSPFQIKLLMMVNPLIYLSLSVVVGTLLYQKVDFRLPLFERWLGISSSSVDFGSIVKYGLVGGILSGVLILLVSLGFKSIIPPELNDIKTPLLARFLYGGIAEEILMRFGFMTFLVWLGSKLLKEIKPSIYWFGIAFSSILFGIGHLPIVFTVVDSPSVWLLIYIVLANSVGGIIFGWLYWKKGLESSMIAHIFTHIVLVMAIAVFH